MKARKKLVCWVPEHDETEGNEIVGELARMCSDTPGRESLNIQKY